MRRACATSLRLARNAAARHSVAEFLLPAAASLSSSSASTGSRRCFSYLAERDSSRLQTYRRRAAQLQRTVDADPKNQQKLADLLRVLNHFDPQQAIRVFERQEPTVAFESDTCVREYIRALVLSNRLDYVDLDLLLRRNWADVVRTAKAQPAEDGSSAHVATAIELRLPDNGEPLKVQVSDSNRRALWRLLRSLMTFLIMVAGVSVFAEGFAGNVQKGVSGFGMGAKKVTPVKEVTTSFDDVKGCDEVKEELQEIILYLKDPDRFTRLGAKLPKGMMMSGSPGTGKTLLARAIAGEAGVPFLQASGSEFEEMFVGVGARRIRDLFTEARKHAPCIVFIDEIDAVATKRYDTTSGGEKEIQRTMLELLNQLDGFDDRGDVKVIMATNRIESLDPAMIRPGRIDRKIEFPLPDEKTKRRIFQIHTSKMTLSDDVNLEEFVVAKDDLSGADIKAVCTEAGMLALRERRMKVTQADMRKAKEKALYKKKGNIPEGMYL
mmetsp:Transcript_13962/g.30854  ORF Transcript_13962/g.30854 Transcript_13962/m.30854 type:complete len:495 (-) Transcript_13962:74-1558(-)